MGSRLRKHLGTAVLVLLLALPSVATAEEFSACWVTTVFNPTKLKEEQITRCRIAGRNIVDYASDNDVPRLA